jgi:hypothetical protein
MDAYNNYCSANSYLSHHLLIYVVKRSFLPVRDKNNVITPFKASHMRETNRTNSGMRTGFAIKTGEKNG